MTLLYSSISATKCVQEAPTTVMKHMTAQDPGEQNQCRCSCFAAHFLIVAPLVDCLLPSLPFVSWPLWKAG